MTSNTIDTSLVQYPRRIKKPSHWVWAGEVYSDEGNYIGMIYRVSTGKYVVAKLADYGHGEIEKVSRSEFVASDFVKWSTMRLSSTRVVSMYKFRNA